MNSNISIIAETAFSHEGNLDYLFSQIDEANKGRAKFVKFQILLDPDLYYVRNHNGLINIGNSIFSEKQWVEILEYSIKLGLKVIVLPLEVTAGDFCLKNEALIEAIEIHSVCINEVHLLKRIKGWSKFIVLGTGGRLISEIDYSLQMTKHVAEKIILMHGFQSFPTDKFNLELNKISEIRKKYNCSIGYADHSGCDDISFIDLCLYSYLMGATYLEKHIVPSRDQKRTDGSSSVTSKEFLELKNKLEDLNLVLGNREFDDLNEPEQTYRKREKKIVASFDLKKGQIIKDNMLSYKISDKTNDLNQKDFNFLIGKRLVCDIDKDEPILRNKLK